MEKTLKEIIKPGYAYRNFGSLKNKEALIRYISYGESSYEIERRIHYDYENIHFSGVGKHCYSHSNGINSKYIYVDFFKSLEKGELVFINKKENLEFIIERLEREVLEKQELIEKHKKEIANLGNTKLK